MREGLNLVQWKKHFAPSPNFLRLAQRKIRLCLGFADTPEFKNARIQINSFQRINLGIDERTFFKPPAKKIPNRIFELIFLSIYCKPF